MKDKLKWQYLQINQSLRIKMNVSRLFVQPRLYAIQLVEPLEDWSYRVHVHSAFELIIPTRNAYKCFLNHRALSVPAWSFLLIQPGQLHQDFYTKDAPFWAGQFSLDSEEKKDDFHFLFPPDFPPLHSPGRSNIPSAFFRRPIIIKITAKEQTKKGSGVRFSVPKPVENAKYHFFLLDPRQRQSARLYSKERNARKNGAKYISTRSRGRLSFKNMIFRVFFKKKPQEMCQNSFDTLKNNLSTIKSQNF